MGRDVFYITTPIYYPNDVPHIGHAYNAVATDFIARYHRLRGEEVFHLTGTDEHGLKLQRAAEAGASPAASGSTRWSRGGGRSGRRLDIAYDDYIRTTEPRHEAAVASVPATPSTKRPRRHLPRDLRGPLLRLVRGLLHRGRAPRRRALPDPRDARSSAWSRRTTSSGSRRTRTGCSSTTRRTPSAVEPETRRNEVLSLDPRAASRTSRSAGRRSIGASRCPGTPKHVCYVWFDALANYITAAGYAADPERFARVWPANIHSIGKDILRFHAVYWPAMLMAAGVEPPKQVWAHGFLTVGGKKMSKTNLTGIHPFELIDAFGVDSYRYYFMREIAFGQDGNFTWEAMMERHNADLANGLGNLASRVLAMLASYFDGVVPDARSRAPSRTCPQVIADARARYDEHMLAVELAAGARGRVGHRRPSQPLPGGEGAVEAREGRGRARRARGRPVRARRDAPDPRGADRADHAARGRAPVGPARASASRSRTSSASRGRRVGRARGRDHDDQGRGPLPAARAPSSGSLGVAIPRMALSTAPAVMGEACRDHVSREAPPIDRMWRPL